jgi:Ser/Thr protein kinase RdoA (MazF antagonist)
MDTLRISAEAERLLPFARMVLHRYPFKVAKVEHLETHSNVMYRVLLSDGRQCVLRVGTPHANTRQNIEFEVAWLAALNKETHLDVVEPIPTGYGDFVVEAAEPGSSLKRSCVLFSWVPGVPLGTGAGTFGYRLLGRMSASLHIHARDWIPPHPDRMRLWDRVFYYDPGADPVVIDEGTHDHIFTAPRRKIIHRAIDLANLAIDLEWQTARPQVVHGDLHEWNVHMAKSRLYAFDFEDVMVATTAQDVSVSLYSSRQRDDHPAVRSAFRKGYEEIAPWPAADDQRIDMFHAARQIMLMNYAARVLPQAEGMAYVQDVMPWLEGFVRKYG